MAVLMNAPVYTGFAMPIQPTHELYSKTLYPETHLEVIPTEKMIRAAAKSIVKNKRICCGYTVGRDTAKEVAEQMLLAAFAAARVIKR